jgi:hypothetical protein
MAANAYRSMFDQFFLSLPISRPGFATMGQKLYDGVNAAALGGAFPAALAGLKAALGGFDVKLTIRETSTADDTEAQRLVRKAIADFVDDTMIDFVKPKLRRLPALKQYKGLTRSAFRRLGHKEVQTQLDVFRALLADHAGPLGTTAPAEQAAALLVQWKNATKARTESEQTIDDSILDLAQDWVLVAQAMRRIQLLLLLEFLEDADGGEARAYSYFDFSGTRNKPRKPAKVDGPQA